jgi:hypothetical protein
VSVHVYSSGDVCSLADFNSWDGDLNIVMRVTPQGQRVKSIVQNATVG